MAMVSGMINLKKFPKLGVRVPVALKRRVRQLALDLEAEVEGLGSRGDELSMESIFAIATLAMLEMSKEEQVAIFETRMPELLALFEAEMPKPKETQCETPASKGAGDVKDLGSGAKIEPPVYPSKKKGRA
jgi:hypothetical protein